MLGTLSLFDALRIKRWSIIWRVTFYFAVGSSLLIAAMGGFLYFTLDRHLEDEHNAFLAEDIELIRDSLARVNSFSEFAENPRVQQRVLMVGSRLHISISDESGKVLISSSNVEMPSSTLAPANVGERVINSELLKLPSDKYYRAVSAWVDIGRVNPHRALAKVALDISLEQRLLRRYHDTLLVTLLIAALCAAALGYAIIRRGLAPVRSIAQAAREITSTQLDRKLELLDVPEELRELVIAFNGMLDRLNQSFSRLSQFSSDLAHEFRTPINNLMGEAQVALSRTRSADEYHAVLESSIEEFERLSRMIENMLFLARADDAELKLVPVLIDARAELEKLAEFYQLLADESEAHIRCMGTAQVHADPLLFRRAVTNLLSNALRHSPSGAEILVDARDVGNGDTEISVANPGPGIPREFQEKIFDRFYQIEQSRDKSGEGAGLGLAIVKTIMRLHGGTVSVASVPGAVTTFTLRFPAPRADTGGQHPSPRQLGMHSVNSDPVAGVSLSHN